MTKILVIEDNNALRENTAELLELSDFQVLTAHNGVQGVELALEHQPDLIICDIMMPELDGFGVLQYLQNSEQCSQIPFIFLTAKTEKAEVQTGLARGADEYLTKPFDDSELLSAVERQLTRLREDAANGNRECAA
jgi:CheY-like chemotaxis protein